MVCLELGNLVHVQAAGNEKSHVLRCWLQLCYLSAGQLHPSLEFPYFFCWILKCNSWDWLERWKKMKVCFSPFCHRGIALTTEEGKDRWRIREKPSSLVLIEPVTGDGWLSSGSTGGYQAHISYFTYNHYRARCCTGRLIGSLPLRSLAQRSKTNNCNTVLDYQELCNEKVPSMWESCLAKRYISNLLQETEGSLSSRAPWTTERVPGQSEPHKEIWVSKENKENA